MVEGGIADGFKQVCAERNLAQSKELPKCFVDQCDPTFRVDHEEPVLHCPENGLCSKNAFGDLLIERLLALSDVLQGKRDPMGLDCSINEKSAGVFSACDLPNESRDLAPRRHPVPPKERCGRCQQPAQDER